MSFQGRTGRYARPLGLLGLVLLVLPRGWGAEPRAEDIVQAESRVDQRRVYQGEAVVLEMRLLTLNRPSVKFRQRRASAFPMPETEGFYAAHLRERGDFELRNGQEYQVSTYYLNLFPTAAGDLTIGAWRFGGTASWRSALGPQRAVLSFSTDPIVVQVMPLPLRPPGFAGAVGDVRLTARLLSADVQAGEACELVLRVSGQGNPDAAGAPELPELPWAQVSGPEVATNVSMEREPVTFEKTFTYQLTPLGPGEQVVPEVKYVFFSPAAGQYRDTRAGPLELFVRASGESRALVTAGGAGGGQAEKVEILADDLHPIITEAGRLRPRRMGAVSRGVVLASPPAVYLLLFAFLRYRRRFEGAPEQARRHFASSASRRALRRLPAVPDPCEGLYQVVRGYLADSFGVPAGGLTAADAAVLLGRAGVPETVAAQLTKVLRACERARYADAPLKAVELKALLRAADRGIAEMDAVCRREGRE